MRAGCDAILVGAGTVRNDNPRLLVRSPARRDDRVAHGLPPSPLKVTVTGAGAARPRCPVLRRPATSEKLVYCADRRRGRRRAPGWARSRPWSTAAGPSTCATWARTCARRGVRRLMVEGGGTVLTQFLTGDLADELHLVVAPFFVGDSRARRFVGDGCFPWNPDRRATLAEVRRIGDVVLLRYALSTGSAMD